MSRLPAHFEFVEPEPTPFKPTEVAYYVPTKGWKRKVCKTEKALERLLSKLDDDGATDIRSRDADV